MVWGCFVFYITRWYKNTPITPLLQRAVLPSEWGCLEGRDTHRCLFNIRAQFFYWLFILIYMLFLIDFLKTHIIFSQMSHMHSFLKFHMLLFNLYCFFFTIFSCCKMYPFKFVFIPLFFYPKTFFDFFSVVCCF